MSGKGRWRWTINDVEVTPGVWKAALAGRVVGRFCGHLFMAAAYTLVGRAVLQMMGWW